MATTITQPTIITLRGEPRSELIDRTYMLPNDSVEHARLNQQSRGIYKLMGNRHVHTNIPETATKIVDIGCGTGAVSLSMAIANPQAKVIGYDLSPVPTLNFTPNLSFVQGDALELDLGGVDFIFSRLLIAGLKGGRWPVLVKKLADSLNTDGTLEMVDLTMRFYRMTDPTDIMGTKVEERFDWSDDFVQAATEQGYDMDAGSNLPTYMKDAGLEDIEVQEYPWPMGHWIKEFLPETSDFESEVTGRNVAGGFAKMMEGRYSPERVTYIKEQMEDMLAKRYGYFQVLRVVTGKKRS